MKNWIIALLLLVIFVGCAAPAAVDAGPGAGADTEGQGSGGAGGGGDLGEGGDAGGGDAGGTGGGGGGGGDAGGGGTGGSTGAGVTCVPGAQRPCYDGPEGTAGVGACAAGLETCDALGTGYGPCEGAVRPTAELCGTEVDDDCDGEVNESCVCVPGATRACYTGPAGTEGIGICHGGVETCASDGFAWGPCAGEVLPAQGEDMNTPVDDDCTGTIHDSLCEIHGVLTCETGFCIGELHCGSAGGPIVCDVVWTCLGN